MKIMIGSIFIVNKGNMTRQWKVIPHPYFDTLCLVRGYAGMKAGKQDTDILHICGPVNIETAYDEAYLLT